MGSGTWTASSFVNYSVATSKRVTADGLLDNSYTAQELFKSRHIQKELNPYNVTRECKDSDEHPNTVPVILALDVTGSMGSAAAEVAKKLNEVMTKLYEQVSDVEFMIMGIGDLAYDDAPIQVSQFESDVRIAEQLDKIYFEGGGGGNGFESYTAAWYFGLRHTNLDCWKRGKKGIIITMGDEPLNPYLPYNYLKAVTGDSLEANVETSQLYADVIEKFDVYHLAVKDRETMYDYYEHRITNSYGKYLDDKHFRVVNLDSISPTIVNIVTDSMSNESVVKHTDKQNNSDGIAW